ncbi:MAG TPA: hypothetical protein VGD80_10155, partial [Kofleriaceae bacterium]
MSLLDVDRLRSASHRNMAEHLAGPFRGGAIETPLALVHRSGKWRARVDWVSRQPLLLLELRTPLAEHGYTVTVEVAPDRGPRSTSTLELAPFSEAGATLPAWIAAPGAASDTAPPFSITVGGLPDAAAAAGVVALRVVEGVLGRLLYAIGAEKARVRRQARELHELRRLGFEFDDSPAHRRMANALDRLGAELAVPRFTDRLAWDAANQRPTSQTMDEPNEAYRKRLALYRPFLLPTRRSTCVVAVVSEPNAVFAVAIALVSTPDDAPRRAFLDWLRTAHLVQPGQPIPAARLLPRKTRHALQAALKQVTAVFTFRAGAFVAPQLVELLDRVARCLVAVGAKTPWRVLRAQDDMAGSRYELG